jgi:hypothetical protein
VDIDRAMAGLTAMEAMRKRRESNYAPEKGEAFIDDEGDLQPGWLSDAVLNEMFAKHKFNNEQKRMIRQTNRLIKQGNGQRMVMINFPATTRLKSGKVVYAPQKAAIRDAVPVAMTISKDGNILYGLMSVTKLQENIKKRAQSKRGKKLYAGNVDAILQDVQAMMDFHLNRPTEDSIVYFNDKYGVVEGDQRKKFINTMFGLLNKKEQAVLNPMLLEDGVKSSDNVYRTYRADRVSKAVPMAPEEYAAMPFSYEAVSQVRMPEAQRAMPEGEQKPTRFMPEDISPEDLNPVANAQEAQGLWADGKQMFAINEMDEKLIPITSKAMLESYPADAIGWMEPEAQTRFMPEGEIEPWRMTKKEFFHPQISRKFIQAESEKDGTIIGTIGDVVHGEKTRAILSPVLDVPIMIIRTPVQEGKKIVAGDKYDFDGASGTFQGKPTIFINPNKRMVGTLWEEAAHQMRRAKGRNIRKADIRKIIGDDKAFEDEYKNDPEEISAKKLSNYLGSLASKEKSHREIVMNAVEAGLPVPQNVLAEYGVTENQTGQMRFMPEKLDSEYMKAVESGDVEAQQRMVDERARKMGYTTGQVYHGTKQRFNEFKSTRDETGLIYFSFDKKFAEQYPRGSGGHREPTPEVRQRIDSVRAERDEVFKPIANELDKKYPNGGDTEEGLAAWVKYFDDQKEWEKSKLDGMTIAQAEMEMGIQVVPAYLATNRIFDPKTGWKEFKTEILDALNEKSVNDLMPQTIKMIEDGNYIIWERKNIIDSVFNKYDGLILNESGSKNIAVRDPSLIKRSDPITRDNSGKVIPLSKRFDVGSRDIRYMPEAYRGTHTAPTSESAPAHDLTGNGVYPADVYTRPDWYEQDAGLEEMKKIKRLKGNPNASITIYRAVPVEVAEEARKTGSPSKYVFRAGDWVTTSKQYAKDHGDSALQGKYRIFSKSVKAKDIYTDGNSIFEWGYNPATEGKAKKSKTKGNSSAIANASKLK